MSGIGALQACLSATIGKLNAGNDRSMGHNRQANKASGEGIETLLDTFQTLPSKKHSLIQFNLESSKIDSNS